MTNNPPVVLQADSKERLDVFLARSLPEYSRSYLQKLCAEGLVHINQNVEIKNRAFVHEGDTVTIHIPAKIEFTGDIPVIFEDDDVMVLNKPAGMLTHAKGAMNEEFSVADFARTHTTDGLDTNRPGIVHRLDRGTSGIIIIAKNQPAKVWLQKQFSTRKVKKAYVALADGHMQQPTARIQLPIERNPKKPQTFRVGGNGKPAETVYEAVHEYAKTTLVKLMPHTGRTHQLRVHLSYSGHPIVGDATYGGSETKLGRMFLHAAQLELTLPSRQRRVFNAPLAPELQDYLDKLQ